MNELAERTVNLPDTIEDLTQFVLVGKAKLNAYMLKLQTINKLSVAQEIREQTLKETQELNAALFAAEQRIGELLLAIPKQSGASNFSRDVEKLKTKSETIKDMGYSKDEASDYQRMAKNPDIVQKVLEEAVANGTVATRTQVMKEIRKADESAREAVRQELAEKDQQIRAQEAKIRELQNRPLEVREVVKDKSLEQENADLKKKLAEANSTANRRYEEKKDAERRLAEAEERLQRGKEEAPGDRLTRNRIDDVEYFTASTYTFVKRFGGFVWSKEELKSVPNDKVARFKTALFSLDAMVKQMIENIGGYQTV